jgi:hypothetical protein
MTCSDTVKYVYLGVEQPHQHAGILVTVIKESLF